MMKKTLFFLMALACCGTVSADYISTLNAQTPAAWYRMADATDTQGGGPLIVNSVNMNVTTASGAGSTLIPDQASLGGLSGGWSTYGGAGGDTVTGLVLPNTGTGSVSFWASKADGIASSTSTTLMASMGGTNFDGTDASMIGGFIRDDGSAGLHIHDAAASIVTHLSVAAGSFPMTTWNHVAYTWDRGTGSGDGEVVMYLNGSIADSASGLSWDAFALDRARWGKETNGARFFGGGMDELAFWDRALNPGEVSSQYSAGLTVIPEPRSAILLLASLVWLSRRLRRA